MGDPGSAPTLRGLADTGKGADMSDRTCTIDGCDKPLRSTGATWCAMHYHRWYRHGDPHGKAPSRYEDLTGRRFGLLEVTTRTGDRWACRCDCGVTTVARVGDLNRGTVTTCGDRKHRRAEHAGYTAAHQRVRTDRGPVADRSCTDCGKPAAHWSYDHDDPDELYAEGISSSPVAYSLRPDHYSPRCVPCHKRYDLDRTDAADHHAA